MDIVTVRALVNNREAAMIIGKQGKTIDQIRYDMRVDINVSKDIESVQDRVVTVVGILDNVVIAYVEMLRIIAQNGPSPAACLRVLIDNQVMGGVIGHKGAKIHYIQDISGAYLLCSKSPMPESTERLVQIRGTWMAVKKALEQVATCILNDKEQGVGTVYYIPGRTTPIYSERVEHVAVPAEEAGGVIGRGGFKIQEVRKVTGCNIAVPHKSNGQNERIFTLRGPSQAVEKALVLLFGHLVREEPTTKAPPSPPSNPLIVYDLIDLSD